MQYTYFAALASLAGLAPPTFAAPATAGLSARGGESKSTVAVQFPKNTRYLGPAGGADSFWGPSGHEFVWDTAELTDLASGEFKRNDFTWIVYDQAKAPDILEDADRFWEMKCYVQAGSGLNGGYASFQLSLDSPFIKQVNGEYSGSTVAVYCPEGKCLKPDGNCDGVPKPSWEDPMAE